MERCKKDLFFNRLLEEKAKMTSIIGKMENDDELGSMNKYHSELSFNDNHPADLGTEMFMMEHEKGLLNKLKKSLYEIETSIEELESEKYGICTICDKEINEERLELIPYVKLCIDCSNRRIALNDKLHETRDLRSERASAKIFNKDYSDENEFDREDSYQEVARVNRIANDPSFSTGDDIGVLDDEGSGSVEKIENISQDYYDHTNK